MRETKDICMKSGSEDRTEPPAQICVCAREGRVLWLKVVKGGKDARTLRCAGVSTFSRCHADMLTC